MAYTSIMTHGKLLRRVNAKGLSPRKVEKLFCDEVNAKDSKVLKQFGDSNVAVVVGKNKAFDKIRKNKKAISITWNNWLEDWLNKPQTKEELESLKKLKRSK